MPKNPPTVRMRRLGAELRKIREALGLSLDDAADLVMTSKSALSRMENAQVVVRPREVEFTVRVLPFGVQSPFPDGAFTLLDVMTGKFTVAVIESLRRSLFIEEDEDIQEYRSAFDTLGSVALDEAGSRALIEQVIRELWSPGGVRHDHLAKG